MPHVVALSSKTEASTTKKTPEEGESEVLRWLKNRVGTVLTKDDAMLEVTFRGPQPLPVVHSWIMDAAAWPLVAVLVAVLVALVLLAMTCLDCRDTGPLSEKMSLLMLD